MNGYSVFQMFAGPYKITPSAYQFMRDWLETTEGGALPENAVDAYFALPIHERDILHNQMMANLAMTREKLLKTRHVCIMTGIYMRGMENIPKEYLEFSSNYIRELGHTIDTLEKDIEDERTY